MVTVVAQNQAMTAANGVTSDIWTDPIDLGNDDRATVMWTIHYLWAFDAGGGGATGTAGYQAYVSNNGADWVPVSGGGDSSPAPTGTIPIPKTFAVNGQFIRFKMTLDVTPGDLAGTCVDILVKFDHA